MPGARSIWWNFTINNPTERLVHDPEKVQFVRYQLEKGENGTPHYQGICQFVDKKTTMKRAKEFLGDRAHVEIPRSLESSLKYAEKVESRVDGPWELGTYLPRRSNKRKLAQMEAEYDEDPDSYHMKDPDMAARIEIRRKRQQFMDDGAQFNLDKMDRPWQVKLRSCLSEEPDDRTIHWVYGPEGNEGKTTFMKCLMKKDWMCLTARGGTDMSYQYVVNGMSKNLVIDVPRKVQKSHYSAVYQLVEEVKNRFVTSTKYRPIQMIDVNCVHVVVMSNRKPDMEMLSKDRICLHDLSVKEVEKKDDKVDV